MIPDNSDFCAIRWNDDHEVAVILLSSVLNPPQIIQLYETYIIEINGEKRKGKIIFEGNLLRKRRIV
jgi:hypothetical protein